MTVFFSFNGSASTDDNGITNFTWTLIDRSLVTLYGVSPSYTFDRPGIYSITLNVTDEAGNYDTDIIIITVNDITNPVAYAGTDQNVNEDTIVSFDGSGSIDNVGITNYTWKFNDGFINNT